MDEIKQMAVRLAMLIDSFEKRGERVEQVVAQATQSIMQASKSSEAAAERVTSRALQDFRQAASMQLGEGLREPVESANRTLQGSVQNLQQAIQALERRQSEANRAHKRDAWRVFLASALASLVMLGGGAYAIAQARDEAAHARWVSGVDAAVRAGRLAPCADEGICAYANHQWLRLDMAEAPGEPARKRK